MELAPMTCLVANVLWGLYLVAITFVQFISIYFIPHTIQDPLIEYTSDILKIFKGSYIHGGKKIQTQFNIEECV